jgi:cation-transporting ATPase 13A3/4/5
MQNKLKPITTSIIEQLHSCKIRTIMATGDNVLTAVSVGRECSIIDPETEVFLGDMKGSGSEEKVYWKSTRNNTHRLNPGTLIPN